MSVHVCVDISCTLSECLFHENYESIIRCPQKITLLVFGLSGHSQFTFLNEQSKCTIRKGDVWLINTDGEDLRRSTGANVSSRMFVVKYSTVSLTNAFKIMDEIGLPLSSTQMIRLGHQKLLDTWVSELFNNPMLIATDRLLAEANALALIARWLCPASESQLSEYSPLKKVLVNILKINLVQFPTLLSNVVSAVLVTLPIHSKSN